MDDALNNLGSATAGIEQHLDYLELPFNLRYTVIDRSIEVQLVGGVSTNFLINNYVTMETESGTGRDRIPVQHTQRELFRECRIGHDLPRGQEPEPDGGAQVPLFPELHQRFFPSCYKALQLWTLHQPELYLLEPFGPFHSRMETNP
jgi:hypothetical protein